jgi:hypothetical protein
MKSGRGDILSGLTAFLKAKEYDLILTEFEKPGITKIVDRDSRAIVKLFKQIPAAVKYRHPIGYLLYTDFYLSNVDMEGGTALLTEIEKYYRDDSITPPELKDVSLVRLSFPEPLFTLTIYGKCTNAS